MHDQDSVEMAEAAEALASGKIDEIVIEDDDEEERATQKAKPKKQHGKSQPKKTSSTWSLPEGVEGVFEPSVGGTRLQGGQSVSNPFPVLLSPRKYGRGADEDSG